MKKNLVRTSTNNSKPHRWRLVQVDGDPAPNQSQKRRRLGAVHHLNTATERNRNVGAAESGGGGRERLRRFDVFENGGVEELGEDEGAGGDVGPAVIGRGGVEVETEGGRRGKVGLGLGAAEGACGAVVGEGGLLGSIECAQPDTCFLPGVTYFGGVASPGSLPHASVVPLARSRRRRRRHHETKPKYQVELKLKKR